MEAASGRGRDRGTAVEEQWRTVQLGTEEASDVVVEGSSGPDRPSDANSGAGDEIHRIFFSHFLFSLFYFGRLVCAIWWCHLLLLGACNLLDNLLHATNNNSISSILTSRQQINYNVIVASKKIYFFPID